MEALCSPYTSVNFAGQHNISTFHSHFSFYGTRSLCLARSIQSVQLYSCLPTNHPNIIHTCVLAVIILYIHLALRPAAHMHTSFPICVTCPGNFIHFDLNIPIMLDGETPLLADFVNLASIHLTYAKFFLSTLF
jgi:hypothetical protein